MIPKNTTPIKNEILIEIFAKGKLSRMEMRIVSYVMRWSWGFDGKERRQDWTRSVMEKQIADDLGVHKVVICRTIKQMIQRKILLTEKLTKGLCYQFNEHYRDWKKLTKKLINKKLTKKLIKVNRKVNKKLTEKLICDAGKQEPESNTETLKETKETIKKRRSEKKHQFSELHLTLTDLLITLIKQNKPDRILGGNNYRERWANDMRLTEEKDERSMDRIREVIEFSQRDSFWKQNIKSVEKLRKHFDDLEMKMIEEQKKGELDWQPPYLEDQEK